MKVTQVSYATGAISWEVHGGSRPPSSGKCPNLVLNSLLNHAVYKSGAVSTSGTRILVGTGTTPVTPEDTTLAAMVLRSTSNGTNDGSYFYRGMSPNETYHIWSGSITATFDPTGVDRVYTEVGIGSISGNQVDQRALFVDELGVPTGVTVLADEYLTIRWETFRYIPSGTSTTVIDVNGVPTTVTSRPINQAGSRNRSSAWTGHLALQAYSSGTLQGETAASVSGTRIDNNTIEMSTSLESDLGVGAAVLVHTASPAMFNAGAGIHKLVSRTSGTGSTPLNALQIHFDPPLPKTATDTLRIFTEHHVFAGEPDDL